MEHISTRSIGVNHIDLRAAADLGITVENVAYAPDGVADYTVMLILMAIRNAQEIVSSANNGDFRLRSVRGKELRDLTVGVVGVGNIGTSGDRAPARIRMPGARRPTTAVRRWQRRSSSPSTNCCARAMSSRSICH